MPKGLLGTSILWYYVFGHNETHAALSISYGSLLNNHESANLAYASVQHDKTKTGFKVRDGFQR